MLYIYFIYITCLIHIYYIYIKITINENYWKTGKNTGHMKCNKIHKLYNVEILIYFLNCQVMWNNPYFSIWYKYGHRFMWLKICL